MNLEEQRDCIQRELDDAIWNCTDIEQQLTTYGKKDDKEWYARAYAALKINRNNRQKLTRKLAEINRQIRAARNSRFEEHLKNSIKDLLGVGAFQAVWDEAHKRLKAEKEQS